MSQNSLDTVKSLIEQIEDVRTEIENAGSELEELQTVADKISTARFGAEKIHDALKSLKEDIEEEMQK